MPDSTAFSDSVRGALEAIESYFDRDWTDGLPIVPPTQERLEEFLATVPRKRDEELGEVPPRLGLATVEKVAINAIMAGCKPAYFPVVLAATEAVLEPTFNLNGVQATANPIAPLVIVSGKAVTELGFNSGYNCFGQGNRANATVGRALRLVLTNIGGGHPGTADKATLGQPAKYSFCVGEAPDSPWEPLHVYRGLGEYESGVTVFGCTFHHIYSVGRVGGEGPDAAKSTLEDYRKHIVETSFEFALAWGGQVGVVVNPYRARLLAKNGWDRRSVVQYFYEKARLPLETVRQFTSEGDLVVSRGVDEEKWPKWLDAADGQDMFPLIRKPENYHVICCGDDFHVFGALLHGWGVMGGYAHSKPIIRR